MRLCFIEGLLADMFNLKDERDETPPQIHFTEKNQFVNSYSNIYLTITISRANSIRQM